MSAVFDKVDDIINSQKDWGQNAIDNANTTLEAVAAIDYPYTIYGHLDEKQFNAFPLVQPSAPGDLVLADKPPDISGEFQMPERPTKPNIVLPSAPTITYPTIPEKPSIVNPVMGNVTMGELLSFLVPSEPVVTLPTFSLNPPEPLKITPVDYSAIFAGIAADITADKGYDSELINAIQDRLLNNVKNGGTGLSAIVEAAIFDRDKEREEQQLEDTTDKTIKLWAQRGFTLPDGMLAHSLSELQKEYMNKRLDRSRDIAIKQAELEQTNIFKSMEMGISLETEIMKLVMEYDKLILQVNEDVCKFANEYINLQIQVNNNLVEVFKARVQIYSALIQAEMAKVEIFRSEIQAMLGIIQANESTVKLYATQIEAEISRYNGLLKGNELIVSIFSEEVRAVVAQAGIEESKIKIYAETIRGLMAMTDIYKSEIDGMTAEINAERAKIEASMSQVEMWKKEADAQIAVYGAQMEEYKANIQWNISSANVTNSVNDSIIRAWAAAIQANVEYARLTEESIRAKSAMELKAAEGVANATATMAAGAMAAVHAGASMEYSESANVTP
jgi:hypothetical protein